MRLLNIASGSSGNSTYIGNESTHILVDAGISRKRIMEGLADADISFCDIDALLITHEHIDHISSLGVLARTRNIPIYATEGTIKGILACNSLGSYDRELLVPVMADKEISVGNIKVKPLSIPHDANDPVCYKFDDGRSKAAVVTDLGEYDDRLADELSGMDMLMLEANHDVRMLEAGPYPYKVKQRILGRYGHLSNENSGRFLSRLLHDNIKSIILAHVSRENNTRDLAKLAVENEVDMSDNKYKAKDFEMNVASQWRPTGVFEF